MTPFLSPGVAPYYDTYATRDARWVAVGAIEPQFYDLLLRGLDLGVDEWTAAQHDTARWPALRATMERAFASKTLAEWAEHFGPTGPFADACVTPVLSLVEAQGGTVAAPGSSPPAAAASAHRTALRPPPAAPFLHSAADTSSMSTSVPAAASATAECVVEPGTHTREVLTQDLGLSHDEVEALLARRVVMQCTTAAAASAPSLPHAPLPPRARL